MSAAVRLRQHWVLDALRTSLWFVPALLVAGALALAVLLLALDVALGPPRHPAARMLLVASEDAARATLSTIAASMPVTSVQTTSVRGPRLASVRSSVAPGASRATTLRSAGSASPATSPNARNTATASVAKKCAFWM